MQLTLDLGIQPLQEPSLVLFPQQLHRTLRKEGRTPARDSRRPLCELMKIPTLLRPR